ncbi:MAG: hypothetical protein COX70_01390 [Flavobacteriales bacterium CG_4_10_14_0_2_um_filter_32_8]|nr:MAG: hypothetical protein COX70_01390 [Flavobacteriales bacterium CG_4_10_14_0_2_um_filter_32_8]PJB14913.1 MAG: hypothetical protein CO118_06130 [Flavobacteriales bacterium CG_4_9_14_3_um_filter_32_8]
MKKYIILSLIFAIGFSSCKNAFEKELGEVEKLLAEVNETEKSLLAVDTAKVFSTKRQMEKDLLTINAINDTLTKAEAFKIDELFSSKKRVFRLAENYADFFGQINFSKNQLKNLKQDIENGLITKEDFAIHFVEEQNAVSELKKKISKRVDGLDVDLEKFRLFRPAIDEFIEHRKNKAADELVK